MAKKKQRGAAPAAPKEVKSAPAKSKEPTAEELGCLAGEVKSFLDQRDQLAQRLAEEIAATEKKLADLKHSAAMLFAEKGDAGESAGDRP